MTIARYVVSVVLIVVGLVWIGQGLGMIGGSSMSGQTIFAILGAALLVGGGALAWPTRHPRRPETRSRGHGSHVGV